MDKYGCIGKKLSHSFSKEIHARLADYEYELIELDVEQVKTFLSDKNFNAINVTIPYKEAVIPYLDEISDIARRIGAVNTVVNKSGKLFGFNTDYYGMKALIERIGLDFRGKKVLVLGTGGTSKTARIVAKDLGAKEVLIVSRNKSNEYIDYEQAIKEQRDAQIIINTTPSGMYPNVKEKPIDVFLFPELEGVIDAIYNPLRTELILDAKEKGIKAEGGLYMLVMQAVVAVEKFLDKKIDKSIADKVFKEILAEKENVVLTGMPGSGKSTVGKILNIKDFEFIDTDKEIENRAGCTIKKLIESKGEKFFRDLEEEVIFDASQKSCRIISTGGGAILRRENVRRLKSNGKIFYIDANIERLSATDTRPLSSTKEKLEKLYLERKDIYKSTADEVVPDMETPEMEANYILEKRMEKTL